jgi:hypothetical protein
MLDASALHPRVGKPLGVPTMRWMVAMGLVLTFGVAAAQQTMTEGVAEESIAKNTFIQACEGDVPPAFSQVQIAAPAKRKVEADGKPTLLYPVHARYTQMCVYGDEEVKAEVDMRMSFFRDAFGKWTGLAWTSGDGYADDQQWGNAANGVRCRVKSLNKVTVDKNYNILTRTPIKDVGYFDCSVVFRAAD